jgi:ABC-type bacteriocin/lantibiotic exporter with double-glycine peptidase domain
VPEVVQTSAMDCGPATLKCLLDGFGIPVSYGRLREACQTDVDGTSIDTIEEVAGQLGLEIEQTVLPLDHLLLAEAHALPAIVVVRFSNGLTHFIVVWRRHGPVLQLMDPAAGRRWIGAEAFLEQVFIHEIPVSASYWRQWAEGDEFCGALRRRLADLRVPQNEITCLIDLARADPAWHTFAALDAAARMVATLVRARGLEKGPSAARCVAVFLKQALAEPTQGNHFIPKPYWSAQPASPDSAGAEQVRLRGAVLVRVLGVRPKGPAAAGGDHVPGAEEQVPSALSPELVAALAESAVNAPRELLRLMRLDGLLAPGTLIGALLLGAGAVILEAVLLRGLFDLGRDLTVSGQRLGAMLAIVAFAGVLLALEMPVTCMILRLGRRLEIRLRLAFLRKIPRLVDRYFQSRLMSDMAERCHMVQALRGVPEVGARFLRNCFELLFTAIGIAWLDPASAPAAALATFAMLGLPLLTNPLLTERDLRLRTHVGALARFYLDSLLGLVAIRAHGAERAMRSEHESLLVEWVRAGFGLQRTVVLVEGLQGLLGVSFAVWLLFRYLSRNPDAGGVLLLVYWALNLPYLAEEIAFLARQYPGLRSITLRLLEPLGAPEEPHLSKTRNGEAASLEDGSRSLKPSGTKDSSANPAAISLSDVSVRAGGHMILEEINVTIQAGEQIAIVGPSGAGKSSLVGLLLGWHRPVCGELLVDGAPLDPRRLEELRRQTAWVEPAVHLWNRSMLDNLCYGASGEASSRIGWVIQQADLLRVLQKLPDGLQTALGEGGALVSGGEGQRVRFGRGLLRQGTRLVILDEPFRGLDHEQRRLLLERARAHWRNVTLLCITHDVGDTLSFARVLVIEQGRLVEDGAPAALAEKSYSRYAALLSAEKAVRQQLWAGDIWRRQYLEDGRLVERAVENEAIP